MIARPAVNAQGRSCYDDGFIAPSRTQTAEVIMKSALVGIVMLAAAMPGSVAAETAGPTATAPITPIEAPRDRAFPGSIQLSVTATDTGRRVIQVHESLSGID